MTKELRGSEKLIASCSTMTTLSQDELEQVAGGGLPPSPMGGIQLSYRPVFPHGIPWPEIFDRGQLNSLLKGGRQF